MTEACSFRVAILAFLTINLASAGRSVHAEEDARALLDRLEKAPKAERPALLAALRKTGGQVIPLLAPRLTAADTVSQVQAAELLAELRIPESVPVLIQALDATHYRTRATAAKALGAVGNKDAVPALCKALNDPFYDVRLESVSALGALADPSALDSLASVFAKDHRDAQGGPAPVALYDGRNPYISSVTPSIWLAACDALARLGPPALPALRERLRAPQADLRSKVVTILLGLKDEPSIPAILAAIQQNQIEPTPAMYSLLGKTGSRLVVPLLTQALDSPNAAIRDAAAAGLGTAGDRSAVPLLVDRYRAGRLGTSALTALAELADTGTEEVFLDALQSQDVAARMAAVGGLEKVGSAACLSALLQLCSDGNAGLSAAARRACAAVLPRAARTKGNQTTEDLSAAMRVDDRGVQLAALAAMGEVGGQRDVEVLRPFLTNQDVSVRRAAAQAVESVASRAWVEVSYGTGQTNWERYHRYPYYPSASFVVLDDRETMNLAGSSLRSLAAPAVALQGISEGIQSADPVVRDACERAGRLVLRDLALEEKPKVAPALMAMLGTQNPVARRLAASGLGEIGDDRSLATLVGLLSDPDRDVKASALKALATATDLDYGQDVAKWQAWWKLRDGPVLAARNVPFDVPELRIVPAASMPLPYGSPQALAFSEPYVHLANGDGGLVVVDARKEDSPSVVAQIPTGGNSQLGIIDQWWARKVFQKAAAVAVSGADVFLATTSEGYDIHHFYVYRIDVSAPEQPRIADVQWQSGTPRAIRAWEKKVFVVADGVLHGLDFAEVGRPAPPIRWSRKDGQKVVPCVDVAVMGSALLAVDEKGKLSVLNMEMKNLGVLDIADRASSICVLDDRAFVGSGSDVWAIDIARPDKPAVLGKASFPGEEVSEVAAFGKRVYARTASRNLYEVDARKPTQPQTRRIAEEVYGAFAVGRNTVAIVEPGVGLSLAPLAHPEKRVGPVQTAGELVGFCGLPDGRVACALDAGGLAVVPATLDAPPRFLIPAGRGRTHAATAAEGRLYVSTDRGLTILSEAGERLGGFLPSRDAPRIKPRPSEDATSVDDISSAWVQGSTAYVLNPPGGLMIVDVTTPQAPKFLGRYDTETNVHNHVAGDGPAWTNERNTPRSVLVRDGRAYIAMGRGGLYVIDVTRPESPKFLGGFFDRSAGKMSASRIRIENGRVHLSDLDNGIYVLDATDPAAIQVVDRFHTANAHGFVLSDTHIVVADGGYGLRAIARTAPLSHAGAYHAPGIWYRDILSDDRGILVGDRAGLVRFRMERGSRTCRTAFQLDKPVTRPDGKPLSAEDVCSQYGLAYRVNAGNSDILSGAYRGHDGVENRLIPTGRDLSDEAGFPNIPVSAQTVAIDPARGRIKFSDGDRDPIRRLGTLPLPMGIPCRILTRGNLLFSINEEGLNLRCYDISDPLKPRLRSAMATGGFACHGLTAKGPYIGASNNLSAFTIYDFSDPDHPVHTSYVGPCSARGMEFDDGDRLYCVNGQAIIVDVKDIAHPKVLGAVPNCHSRDFCARGDFLYMPSQDGLAIYNVKDPKNPTLATTYPGVWTHPVVRGNRLYLAGQRFDILDVTNSAAPRPISSLAVNGATLTLDRDFAFLGDNNRLHILDVSDVNAPKVLSTIGNLPDKYGGPKGEVSSMGLSENGDTLFVGMKWYGFLVVDVRDKRQPKIVSGINDTAGDYTGIAVDDDRAYIGMNWGALYIADVKDPANPKLVGDTRRLIRGATGPSIHGKTVTFSGFEDNPSLRVVDIANPAAPRLLSEWRVPATWDDPRRGGGSFADRFGKYLVIPWACATLDISDPTAPRLAGTLDDREAHHQKVVVQGHHAYLANYHRKPDLGLRIASLADPRRPVIVGQLNVDFSGGYYFGQGMRLHGDFLYGVSYGPFLVVDVKDPAKPRLVSATELRGFGSDCFVDYPYAYVTMYYGGLNILDISDPANPVLVDWVGYGGWQDEAGWDNLGCYQSVGVYRGTACITEYYTGLMTFDVPTADQSPKGALTVRIQPPGN